MNRRSFIAATLAAATMALTAAPALASSNWNHLGTKKVNWLIDHDTVHVGASQGVFDKVLIKVRGNNLFMYKMKVHYLNGSSQVIPLQFHFNRGNRSRVIDLAGNNRIIKTIEMTYGKPANGNGATWVEVFGRH